MSLGSCPGRKTLRCNQYIWVVLWIIVSIALGRQESLWPRGPLRELMLLEITAFSGCWGNKLQWKGWVNSPLWWLQSACQLLIKAEITPITSTGPTRLLESTSSWDVDWPFPKQNSVVCGQILQALGHQPLRLTLSWSHGRSSVWDCSSCVNMFLQVVMPCVFPWSHYCSQVKYTFLRDSFKSWCLSEFFWGLGK